MSEVTPSHQSENERLRGLYIETIKKSVGDFLYKFDYKYTDRPVTPFTYVDLRTGRKHHLTEYDELRENGLTGSNVAHTIIGMKRLNHLQLAVETVIKEQIPGDLIETGILRGGACVFMRAILEAYGVRDRIVWAADSFKGFPVRSEDSPGSIDFDPYNKWSASREEVEGIFANYGFADNQLQILEGWFSETLPAAPIEKLAILRLDGDMYDSTLDALKALYHKLSPGGFVIVDDYFAFDECREAVRRFRQAEGIKTAIERVDPVCVYWRKEA